MCCSRLHTDKTYFRPVNNPFRHPTLFVQVMYLKLYKLFYYVLLLGIMLGVASTKIKEVDQNIDSGQTRGVQVGSNNARKNMKTLI